MRFGIKARQLISFSFLLCIVVASIVLLFLNELSRTISSAENRELNSLGRALEGALAASSDTAADMAWLASIIPEAKEAVAAHDRERLNRLFVPGFQMLSQKAQINQFQFHTSPATSLFRVNMPEKFGDDLSSFRLTVVEANRTQQPVVGLESGVSGIGARGIVPIWFNNQLVGTVEFGASVGQDFVDAFKKRYGVNVAIYTPDAATKGFKRLASTVQEAFLSDEDLKKAGDGGKAIRQGEHLGISVAAIAIPLSDYSGKPVAVAEIIMDAHEYELQYSGARRFGLIVALMALVLGSLVTWLLARGISKPLTSITEVIHQLAQGNLEISPPFTEKMDEVGQIARSTEVFRQGLIQARALSAQRELEQEEKEKGRKAQLRLVEEFNGRISDVIDTVINSAKQLEKSAQTMAQVSEQTGQQTVAAAMASEEAASNVQTVAAASEELAASSREIAGQMARASEVTRSAASEATATDQLVYGLTDAASKIGDIVKLINDIAGQTNLLALNATIEAARAGDAGKGFAVVANEVKSLANQTAKATDEITTQIGAVQQKTQEAAIAVRDIATTIQQIDGISGAIAAALEEQGTATREITRSAQQAHAGTAEVAHNVAGASGGAKQSSKSADSVLLASRNLTQISESMRALADDFIIRLQSGETRSS